MSSEAAVFSPLKEKSKYERSAGIRQPEPPPDLVERLAGGVVSSLAQQGVTPPLRNPEQHGVPAAHEECDERRLRIGLLQRVREQVRLHVVHADER